MQSIKRQLLHTALVALTAAPICSAALGTAFTFQGRLDSTNGVAEGSHDLEFWLWDRDAGGNFLGSISYKNYPVSNGLFTVSLDYGYASLADAEARWIEIHVKESADTNNPVALSPRIALSPAPFAIIADNVPDGSISSNKIQANAISQDKIADGSIVATKLSAGAVTAPSIAAGAINGLHITNNAIGALHIAANSISSSKIVDGSLLGADLAPGTISATNLAKPYRSGVIPLADVTNTFYRRPLTQAFLPPFAATPVVTFAVTPSPDGALVTPELSSKSTTGFAVRLRSVPLVEPIDYSSSPIFFDEPVAGLVSSAGTLVPACVSAKFEPGFSTVAHGVYFMRAADAQGHAWSTFEVNTNGNNGVLLADGTNQSVIAYTLRIGTTSRHGLFAVRATTSDGSAWSNPVNCDLDVYHATSPGIAHIGGRPAIAYVDDVTSNATAYLKFVRSNDAIGGTWGTPLTIVTSAYFIANDVENPRLTMVGGRPAVFYSNAGYVKMVRANDPTGGTWGATSTIFSPTNILFFLDAKPIGGNPAVLFSIYEANKYYYMRALDSNGTAWGSAVEIGNQRGANASARLIDAGGVPAICFDGGGPFYTEALDASGATWSTPVKMAQRSTALFSQLIWTGGGLAAIAVTDDRQQLEYYWSGPSPQELQWTAVQP